MLTSILLIILSVWFMIAPDALEYSQTQAGAFSTIIGTCLLALATLSVGSALAVLRWACMAVSIVMLASPLWLVDNNPSALVVNLISGLLALSLSVLSFSGYSGYSEKRKLPARGFGLWSRSTDGWKKMTWS